MDKDDVYSVVISEKTKEMLVSHTAFLAKVSPEAAKRLVEAGVGSYEVVLTDFGYHIMLCTSVIKPSGSEPISKDAFMADVLVDGTLANLFKTYKLNLISSTQVESITNSFINKNRESGVTLYKDRFADLIPEEETEDDGHDGHNH